MADLTAATVVPYNVSSMVTTRTILQRIVKSVIPQGCSGETKNCKKTLEHHHRGTLRTERGEEKNTQQT